MSRVKLFDVAVVINRFLMGTICKTSRDRPKSAPYPRLKNSKKTSKCQVFVYSSRKSKIFRKFFLKKLHTKKMDRVARRGPLARTPGALKSHNAEKLKGGTLWGFSTSILSQNMKKLKKIFFYFRDKLSQCRKKLKGGTLWDFPTSILSQNIKKMQGDPLKKNFEKKIRKKCLAVPKKIWKGGLFGLARYDMLRGKTGKTILVQFARPNGAIWHHNIL